MARSAFVRINPDYLEDVQLSDIDPAV